jgi:hypothetical protein
VISFPRVALIGVLALAASTSCDLLFKENADRMGVTLSTDGVPEIVSVLCPGEQLEKLSLEDPASVTEEGEVMTVWWQVRASDRSGGRVHTVRVSDPPPAGYDLEVPLSIEFNGETSYLAAVDIRTDEGAPTGASREFRMDDLQQGNVLTRGGTRVAFDEFVEAASASC